MEYRFNDIEKKWQEKWRESKAYKVSNESNKPKYYVLDMFPYPSGAGLHVGHPLGYIASDIYSRYKRLKGFNVLHPMGFDSFGLPAEQYALETGQHPADTTEKNIATFKSQLDKIGFCFDWDREVRTSDPKYYKWTQWIFLQLYNSYFCNTEKKALPVSALVKKYETKGAMPKTGEPIPGVHFTADEWNGFSKQQQEEKLMNRRLAFSKYGEVNWCEALGTVLANDEVVNGVSERGGHPVEKKKMRQWYLRITAYADRLLDGLETVEFSDSMKEMQKNWIGKSQGAEMDFAIKGNDKKLRVYTTRPDTIFGVDFMVVAPEHELVASITSAEQKESIEKYLHYVKSRSERERLAEAKTITGCFTGAYAINPFDGREIPIWIAEYVLAGYGTGAIMAVPCGDQRDFAFAKYFDIPITNIIGEHFNGEEANATKEAILQNSGFLNGLLMKDAIGIAVDKIEELGIGKRKVNYRMRDAGFSRQRYWGEPFPIIWSDGIAIPLDADELPLELPHVDKYGPGPEGEGPLANIKDWVNLTPSPSPRERGAREHEDLASADGVAFAASKNDQPDYFNSTLQEWKNTLVFAKENRANVTEAEAVIWQKIRDRQIDGFKFRRQHPIAGYIPAFVCLDKKLIIEIDGGYHNMEEQKKFDVARQNWLAENGFEMLRFTNEEVKGDLKEVLNKITQTLSKEKHQSSLESNSPLFWRGIGGEVKRETSTMPGYAGSSWYFLRYMDPHNGETFCDRKASDYWNQVDLYIGGTEHAVGHLLYSRLWTKVLYDLGHIGYDEPFKRLVNQGMITGKSFFLMLDHVYGNKIVSYKKESSLNAFIRLKYGHQFVENSGRLTKKVLDKQIEEGVIDELPYEINWEREGDEEFIFVKEESEKMSKSKFNVDNPDDLVVKFGADTFRMYEMFLGPVEQSKPWDTKGIEGVHRFLRKLWRLFNDEVKGPIWTSVAPSLSERAGGEASDAELKVLHRTIKKIEEDTDRFSFNTAVSSFMICVNDLADLKCHKKEVLEKVLILLTPYAPHIAEELWSQLGNEGTILDAQYPTFNPALLVESSKEYPISINGKVRANINLSLDLDQAAVEAIIVQNEVVQKWLDGKAPKKIIYVKNKMVNVVI